MKLRRNRVLLLALCAAAMLCAAGAAWGSSWLYSTTSGDILDESANPKPTYGIGRIDFDGNGNWPVPTVILSNDTYATAVGEFKKDGKKYLYATRTDKEKEKNNTKELTKFYAVCDPAGGVDILVDTTKYHELTLPKNQNVSVDIDLPPDEYNGLIYYIEGNDGKSGSTPYLFAKDAVRWENTRSVALPQGYDAHSVVSLLPDSKNFFYVWSTKRNEGKTATCPYTSISSDVSVYDRNTLTHLKTFHYVRTGFDSTLQSADDEPQSYNMGRGLVVIVSDQENIENNKAVALVAYDDASSPAAHIVRIDESMSPPTAEVIVTSTDIGGWNIDIESPMPDYDGGLYFECYSGDANVVSDPNYRESRIVHWKKNGQIVSLDQSMNLAQSNGELVISSGKLKGQIVVFQMNQTGGTADGGNADNKIRVYLWDGETTGKPTVIDETGIIGVEIEKPFTDGGNGLYFMAERKKGNDEADALYRWDGSKTTQLIWQSDCEMEVEGEAVPKDKNGNNGFYFVNVSADLNEEEKKGTVTLSLLHCQGSPATIVCDLGSFDVPASRFRAVDETGKAISADEALENEYGYLEDTDHSVLFVGGGPLGGKYKLTALEWTDGTRKNLTSDNIKTTFIDEDLGGVANIAGAVAFTEGGGSSSSSSGCDAGFSGAALLALAGLFLLRKRER